MRDVNETFIGHLGQLAANRAYGTSMGHMRHFSFVAALDALEAEAEKTKAALREVLKKLGV